MFYQKKSGLGENILDGGQTINAALASDKKKKLPKTKKPGISTILSFPPECYRLRCVILLSESEMLFRTIREPGYRPGEGPGNTLRCSLGLQKRQQWPFLLAAPREPLFIAGCFPHPRPGRDRLAARGVAQAYAHASSPGFLPAAPFRHRVFDLHLNEALRAVSVA